MSSRLSNKSDKNLGDFEDENSVDEEMLHLAQSLQHHQVSNELLDILRSPWVSFKRT